MARYSPTGFAAVVCLVALGGCNNERDPYLRSDVWQPTGANAANIAAMVANPNDLIRGRHAPVEDVKAPALNVEHVWMDQPKPFLGAGGSGSGGGAGGSGQGGSGGGGGGGGGGS